MRRLRSCQYCFSYHSTDEICPKKPKRKTMSNQDVKEQNKIYSSSRWQRLRELVKRDSNYMCVICKSKGDISYADQVHHIVPITLNKDLSYSYENLVPLCSHHHEEIHKKNINSKEKFLKYIEENKI